MAGDEGLSIVESDATTQMKSVCEPVARNVPSFGERWLDLRIWGEAGETVEEVADGASRWYVGRECRVERARVVLISGVYEGASRRCALLSEARERMARDEGLSR
jgi:hypothetical protein